MKCLVVLAVCLGISCSWSVKQNMDALDDPSWKAWKSFHNKNYDDEGEERVRNFIWQDNLKRIVSHNEVHKYKLAMNHLGDMVRFKTGIPDSREEDWRYRLPKAASCKGVLGHPPQKIFKTEVLRNGISGILRPSQSVIMSHFF